MIEKLLALIERKKSMLKNGWENGYTIPETVEILLGITFVVLGICLLF